MTASDLAAGFLPATDDRSSLPGGLLLAVAALAGMGASLAVLHLPHAWAVAAAANVGAIGLLALTQAAGAWAVAASRASPARVRGAATARSF